MATYRVLIFLGLSLAVAWYSYFGRPQMKFDLSPVTIRRPHIVHQPKMPETLTGSARVLDGDTIAIRGFTVRLDGIDAPEVRQTCRSDAGNTWPCGATARDELRSKTGMATVLCARRGQDRYGRDMGLCTSGNEELNVWLVREGWALSYVPFGDRYRSEEEENDAKRNRRGIWTGSFVAPWIWRDQHESGPNRNAPEPTKGPKRIRVGP